jgi:hypothetical protein
LPKVDGLEVFVSRLPKEECDLAREVFEGDNLLLREMAVVVVHLHQRRLPRRLECAEDDRKVDRQEGHLVYYER